MSEVGKDLFCGWLSGIGQVLTMMPFENIKIKVVSKPAEYTGYIQCFRKTVSEEGAISFYKGMLTNLLGVGPQVALQFGTVETLKKYIKRNIEKDSENLSLKYVAFSGAMSGIPSAIVVTPLDHARFRVALEKTKVEGGSIGMAKQILKNFGFRKLYLGFNSTLSREVVLLTAYFASYDGLKRMLNPDPHHVKLANAMLAGGITGIISWLVSYPFDFVKTLIQTDSLSSPKHNSMAGYFREQISKGSIMRIFTGLQIMMYRAFFVNATGFMCFEVGKKLVYAQPSPQQQQ